MQKRDVTETEGIRRFVYKPTKCDQDVVHNLDVLYHVWIVLNVEQGTEQAILQLIKPLERNHSNAPLGYFRKNMPGSFIARFTFDEALSAIRDWASLGF